VRPSDHRSALVRPQPHPGIPSKAVRCSGGNRLAQYRSRCTAAHRPSRKPSTTALVGGLAPPWSAAYARNRDRPCCQRVWVAWVQAVIGPDPCGPPGPAGARGTCPLRFPPITAESATRPARVGLDPDARRPATSPGATPPRAAHSGAVSPAPWTVPAGG